MEEWRLQDFDLATVKAPKSLLSSHNSLLTYDTRTENIGSTGPSVGTCTFFEYVPAWLI